MNEKELKLIEELSEKCNVRMLKGETEYGDSWKHKVMIEEIEDEIADAINYLKFLYIKIRKIKEKWKE